MKFEVNDQVRKEKGYPFKGYIVSVFTNRNGDVRYVVEHANEIGMLHIYTDKQLVKGWEDESNINS